MFDLLEELGDRSEAHLFVDRAVGLRAVTILDDQTLGPAVGGCRTRAYASTQDAVRDAVRLARAMTIKCALAGLPAGGGKTVVLEAPGMDRAKAFERLGDQIEALGGRYRTAGDLGTEAADLAALARRTQFVHTDTEQLAAATAWGILRCAEAAFASCDGPPMSRAHVVVQGLGVIGSAAARAFATAGARLTVADLDSARARALADELGAEVVSSAQVLGLHADLLCPCAHGEVIDVGVARELSFRVVVGGANNILTGPDAGVELQRREVVFVPDAISSAGAVADGIGRALMDREDASDLVDGLGRTAAAVLREARETGETPTAVAHRMAHARIASACAELSDSTC